MNKLRCSLPLIILLTSVCIYASPKKQENIRTERQPERFSGRYEGRDYGRHSQRQDHRPNEREPHMLRPSRKNALFASAKDSFVGLKETVEEAKIIRREKNPQIIIDTLYETIDNNLYNNNEPARAYLINEILIHLYHCTKSNLETRDHFINKKIIKTNKQKNEAIGYSTLIRVLELITGTNKQKYSKTQKENYYNIVKNLIWWLGADPTIDDGTGKTHCYAYKTICKSEKKREFTDQNWSKNSLHYALDITDKDIRNNIIKILNNSFTGQNKQHTKYIKQYKKSKQQLFNKLGRNTQIVMTCETGITKALNSHYFETLKYLIQAGANPTVTNLDKKTFLHSCASSMTIREIEYLLSNITQDKLLDFINSKDIEGNTPLHAIAHSLKGAYEYSVTKKEIPIEQAKIVTIGLLENGADLTTTGKYGNTVLHWLIGYKSATYKGFDLLKAILEYEIPANKLSVALKTPASFKDWWIEKTPVELLYDLFDYKQIVLDEKIERLDNVRLMLSDAKEDLEISQELIKKVNKSTQQEINLALTKKLEMLRNSFHEYIKAVEIELDILKKSDQEIEVISL